MNKQTNAEPASVTKPTIECVKSAHGKFNDAATAYADYGAADTEPHAVYKRMVREALRGTVPYISSEPEYWSLYSSQMDCSIAGLALASAAASVAIAILNAPIAHLHLIREYFQKQNILEA